MVRMILIGAALVVMAGDGNGIDDIITIAWTGTINSDPPMVSISVRKSRYSHELLTKNGEFVINLVTKDLCYAMDYCGVKSGRDVDKFAEMKMTKAEAALKMNYSRAALSQYLNGKYASDPTELEKKVREFLAATGGVAEGQEPENSVPTGAGTLKKKVEFFESRDFVQTIGVCQACQEYMGLGIIVGKSGQGKTHALKKYAELPRVAYIECDDTMACRDLVEAIENGIGLPKGYGGTIWSRVNRIREFFNTNEGFLLIIDEADKLINKYTQKKMEILRGIFDQSNVGIVIAGEPRLETELKGNLARFANRMDFYYKLKGLSKNEVVDYLEGYEVDEAAMGEMISRATNTQSGCFRLLDRTLNNVLRILKQKGETRITMKIVSEASNMMML